MKKTIGVYADTFNGKVGQTFAYMQFLSQFGHVRLISTLDNFANIINEVDMLVVPGGADVDSLLYNGIPGVMDGRVNQHYEFLDRTLINLFVQHKKPIVGICRGMQAINVYFGGTLKQHVVGHQQESERHITRQELQFFALENNIFVNSMHHQSIDKVGEGLHIVGYTRRNDNCYSEENHSFPWRTYDKNNSVSKREDVPAIIEVIEHNSLPIVAFQYHPEEFNCQYAVSKIKKLLNQ